MIQPAYTANQFLTRRHMQAFQIHMEIMDKHFCSHVNSQVVQIYMQAFRT